MDRLSRGGPNHKRIILKYNIRQLDMNMIGVE